jgi:hypothetical protein
MLLGTGGNLSEYGTDGRAVPTTYETCEALEYTYDCAC